MTPDVQTVLAHLADEGVPVRALARAATTPAEQVRSFIKSQIEAGRLVEMPPDDWPPGQKRDARQGHVEDNDVDAMLFACHSVLRVTRMQGVVLTTLARKKGLGCTKEHLVSAMAGYRSAAKDEPDKKLVDVMICNIRKKLKGFGINIRTIHGQGYALDKGHRERLMLVLNGVPRNEWPPLQPAGPIRMADDGKTKKPDITSEDDEFAEYEDSASEDDASEAA